ncbi:MAG: Na/Pi cotransporter family protein [Clostridia bacterium]|nr:Na/Pi cotransporter family protein [Clostridia bacterium]
MDIFSIVKLCGGLALFIYGMTVMGDALEKVAGEKLEKTLETMAGNIFKSIFLGALVTAVIQSSSATTVMVVGFVNAGIMTLKQAVGIIMGANIGTTMTAQLLRLGGGDSASTIMKFLKPSNLAYVAVAVGFLLMIIKKKKKLKDVGEILLGLGVLFIGMNTMEGAVSGLRELPAFQAMFTTLKNPILGVLAGALVTAAIQSSSASVGILQAVAATGAVSFAAAVPIIFGQNIGTCITSFMSSMGASKNARRAAMIHLYFNLVGTILFMIAMYAIKAVVGFSFWDNPITKADIANFHTIFNVVVTVVFIPFNGLLVKLAEKTIKVDEKDNELDLELARLDDRFLATPAIAIEQCHKVVTTMGNIALGNLMITNAAVVDGIPLNEETFNENESFLDNGEARINKYMLSIKEDDLSPQGRKLYEEIMHTVSDFEKIGDYTENIYEQYQSIVDNGISFSEEAMFELKVIRDATEEIVELATQAFTEGDIAVAARIEALEENIDGMREALKSKHIHRLRTGLCTVDVGMPFLDIIQNYEKIADHCSKIAIYVMMYNDDTDSFDVHEYRKMTKKAHNGEYDKWLGEYEDKYLSRLV